MYKILVLMLLAFIAGRSIWVYPHMSGVSFGVGNLGYNVSYRELQ